MSLPTQDISSTSFGTLLFFVVSFVTGKCTRHRLLACGQQIHFFVHQFCAFSLLTCKLEQYSPIIKPLTSHYLSRLELRSDTAPEYPHTVPKCTSSIGSLWYRLRMSKRWQFVALGLAVRWTTLNEHSSKAVIFLT